MNDIWGFIVNQLKLQYIYIYIYVILFYSMTSEDNYIINSPVVTSEKKVIRTPPILSRANNNNNNNKVVLSPLTNLTTVANTSINNNNEQSHINTILPSPYSINNNINNNDKINFTFKVTKPTQEEKQENQQPQNKSPSLSTISLKPITTTQYTALSDNNKMEISDEELEGIDSDNEITLTPPPPIISTPIEQPPPITLTTTTIQTKEKETVKETVREKEIIEQKSPIRTTTKTQQQPIDSPSPLTKTNSIDYDTGAENKSKNRLLSALTTLIDTNNNNQQQQKQQKEKEEPVKEYVFNSNNSNGKSIVDEITFDDLSIDIKIRVLGMKMMIINDIKTASEITNIQQKYSIKKIPEIFESPIQYQEIYQATMNTEFKEILRGKYKNNNIPVYKSSFISYAKCELKDNLYFLFFRVEDYNHFSRDLKRNELIVISDDSGKVKLETFSLYINEISDADEIPLLIYCLNPPTMFNINKKYKLKRIENVTTYLRETQAIKSFTNIAESIFLINPKNHQKQCIYYYYYYIVITQSDQVLPFNLLANNDYGKVYFYLL